MTSPRSPRLGRAIAGVAGLSLLLAACGGSSYSREDAISDLMDGSGMDQETAECIVDKVEDEFGIEKLESSDDVTDEDEAKLLEITTECLFGE